jgi:hypothetical protein
MTSCCSIHHKQVLLANQPIYKSIDAYLRPSREGAHSKRLVMVRRRLLSSAYGVLTPKVLVPYWRTRERWINNHAEESRLS